MNNRLKEVRKQLKLNQKELGEKVKLSQTHISSLENGTREMTDRIIADYCREFNVNEDWLRTGQGEMFIESDSTIIAELASEYHLDPIDQKIIEHYVGLDEGDRQTIKDYVVSLAQQISSMGEAAAYLEPTPEQIAAEHGESYRQEVLVSLKKATSSASHEKSEGETS